MSSTRAIAHNTIIQIIGKVISVFLGLLAIGLMTRYLGTEKFGWYVTTTTFLQFAYLFIDLGLIPVTAQMLGEKIIPEEKLLPNLLGFRFVTGFILMIIAPLVALFFPYPNEVKIAISLTSISFLVIAMNQIFTGFFQYKLKMIYCSLSELIGRLALVIQLWFLINHHGSFLWIMTAIVIATTLNMSSLWLFAHQHIKTNLAFDKTVWKAIWHKSWPIGISVIFNVIYLKGDTILLSLYRSQAEVGIYGAAYRVIDILTQLAMMIMGVILPILSFQWVNKNKEHFQKQLQQSFNIMMMIGVPIVGGLWVLADKIMILVAGNDFAFAGYPLRILSLAIFGLYLGAVFGHTAVAINKQKKTMWIYFSDAILTLIGYLIFIPKFGIAGAAWMTVFSELYAGILLFATVYYYTKEKLNFTAFYKIIFCTLIMAGVLSLLPGLHGAFVILLLFIGMVVYGGMLIITKTISPNTLTEIFTSQKIK